MKIVEIGCGAGNSVFPLLSANENPHLSLHAYDYSSHAVKLVQNNPLYKSPPAGAIQAAVWDLTSQDGLPSGLEEGSVDITILVFVLSALHPEEWGRAVRNIHAMLKPGGLLLLRDYGRHDLTQLRFRTGRLLEDNFYIRGDKTRVYFFDIDELAVIFSGASAQESNGDVNVITDEDGIAADDEILSREFSVGSLVAPNCTDGEASPTHGEISNLIHPILQTPFKECPSQPLFSIEQLAADRRLIVNRKRQLKMYRIWMQGKFRKLSGHE
jgi:tRNAThr (cytosine32-N3)-methyltransferase